MLWIYASKFFPFKWLLISSFTVVAFFFYLNKLTISWTQYSDTYFRRKLFITALIIRVIAVLALYFFFIKMTGKPYEFEAADSLFYNQIGRYLSDILLNGNFNLYNKLWFLDISDRGFPIYLGIIYALFFKSILIARLFNALLGAWSCVLIYDLAKRNFNEQTARIAGIMTMLVPNLIYYCGLHLKETLMVFLIIAFINLADKLLRAKHIKIIDAVLLVIAGGSIFLFRTVLAVCIILSLLSTMLIISERISSLGRKIFIGFCLLIAGSVILFTCIEKRSQLLHNKTLYQSTKPNAVFCYEKRWK